jgi:cell wall-associated NlpC family hydrolase
MNSTDVVNQVKAGESPAAVAYRQLRDASQDAPRAARRRFDSYSLGMIVVLAAVLATVVAMTSFRSRPSSAEVVVGNPVMVQGAVVFGAPGATIVPVPTYPAAAAPPVRMGGWTPQIGVQIAQRAMHWLNWPYSFAGGNAAGPTYGVAVDQASRNDGRVLGFDCSGLVLYALAPWRSLDHLASAQYRETGTWHPALNSLMPGDLVFWSKDGSIDGVGHVAVYIGDGNVIQAPHSGARITITPLMQVESGAIGTVRPLT